MRLFQACLTVLPTRKQRWVAEGDNPSQEQIVAAMKKEYHDMLAGSEERSKVSFNAGAIP